jgi:photosystem II stability/assembly factor-like uncharacterized protein
LVIDPITPSTLYAGADGSSVFKSTDGGNRWTEFNNGLPTFGRYSPRPQPAIIFTLAIDPVTPSTLYAGTDAGGVFKSTDAGTNWSAMNNGLPTYTYYGIAYTSAIFTLSIDPLTPSTLYAGVGAGGVFKSTDAGSNWTDSSTGLPGNEVEALAIDPLTPSTLYAGTNGAGVYKSTDRGTSWTAMSNGLSDLFIDTLTIDPLTPSTLYAGTSNGVYIFVGDTINGGQGGSNHSSSSDSGCFIGTVLP